VRSKSLPIVLLAMAVAGCDAAGAGGAGTYAPPDPGAPAGDARAGQDFVLLSDAMVLEPGPADAASDCWAEVGGVLPFEIGMSDLGAPQNDSWVKEFGPAPGGCGEAGEPCGPGESCVDLDGDGTVACEAVSDCSEKGALDLPEVLTQLLFTGHLYVKLEAKVRAGAPSCTSLSCPAKTPCCNECFAPLFAGDLDFPILLLGKGLAVGCEGTECDFDDDCDTASAQCALAKVCSPLQPGKYYWLWGDIDLLGGQVQFRLDGWCLVL